ncbi:MAG: hypothetical protein EPO57_04125 [Chitinophagaceae bacterium]|nr:MAG: hypothetical protein EPO57_04125 [Chitinophagaceae bacterium]
MTSPNYISYKDSVARVVQKDGLYYRFILNDYKTEYDHLMQSGLYEKLHAKGLLISHSEIENEADAFTLSPAAQLKLYKILKPEQIAFQGYPFEWSYTQWNKAIIAYLQINQIALSYGMILKDATPYNFYMTEGRAVLLDTSSFEFFKEGAKWNAYMQFCSEFLSPLSLMHYNGQRWSRITRSHLRGLPLNFVSRQLPLKSWFNVNTLLHIHLHAKFAHKNGVSPSKNSNGFSLEKLKSLMGMMLSNIQNWKSAYQFEKHWSTYYKNDIESEYYLKHKQQFINKWLTQLKPASVLDVGANTGKFSFIAANYSNKVIALESDDLCVDEIEKQIQQKGLNNVYAIVMDLVDTTSNLGALNKELSSIYTRTNSIMVMALALVHHLHISNQLSFAQIAEMFSLFSSKYLIVEFIPITDNKVQLLIQDKKMDLRDYREEHFTKALSNWFNVKEKYVLGDSQRKLFLLEKK